MVQKENAECFIVEMNKWKNKKGNEVVSHHNKCSWSVEQLKISVNTFMMNKSSD